MDNYTILIRGRSSLKVVAGKPRIIVPVVCSCTIQDVGMMVGVGYYFAPRHSLLHGRKVVLSEEPTAIVAWVDVSCCLIQAWRAMKLLEALPKIEGEYVLRACLRLFERVIIWSDILAITANPEEVLNTESLRLLRKELVVSGPSVVELGNLVRRAMAADVPICWEEIWHEAEVGNVVLPSFLMPPTDGVIH